MTPLLIGKEGVSIIVQSREHLPPHIHAFHGDDEALVYIRTGKIFEGSLPNKKLKVVQDWLDEKNNRATVEEIFYELNPRLRPQKAESKTAVKKKRKNKGGK